jgi:hypothetical protein
MKKTVPKFLIAKNEAAKPGASYIVHTQDPAFIGELFKFETISERTKFINDNSDKEVITINPTTLLIISKYLNAVDQVSDKSYLESKIVHWVIANYLNN